MSLGRFTLSSFQRAWDPGASSNLPTCSHGCRGYMVADWWKCGETNGSLMAIWGHQFLPKLIWLYVATMVFPKIMLFGIIPWCSSYVPHILPRVSHIFHDFVNRFPYVPWFSRISHIFPQQSLPIWLVVEPPLWKIWVNWDDYSIPKSDGKIKVMFQSPPTR